MAADFGAVSLARQSQFDVHPMRHMPIHYLSPIGSQLIDYANDINWQGVGIGVGTPHTLS